MTANKNTYQLGYQRHSGKLYANGEYTKIFTFKVPKYISGIFYISVHTDARNDVFEYTNNDNNIKVLVREAFFQYNLYFKL